MSAIWKVEKIPILDDNFVFVLQSQNKAWVVDPGEAKPVLDFLQSQNLTCEAILITHHHNDHIAGIKEILAQHSCPIYAPLKNKDQITDATKFIIEGDKIIMFDLEVEAWELPGHTHGHIAYWIPKMNWLFAGDVIFALGCGKLFEGTYEQMFHALGRIKNLPEQTLIFCTHDYYPANSKFCIANNIEISDYDSIHPLLLAQEKEFNPFLKADNVEKFTILRKKRNLF